MELFLSNKQVITKSTETPSRMNCLHRKAYRRVISLTLNDIFIKSVLGSQLLATYTLTDSIITWIFMQRYIGVTLCTTPVGKNCIDSIKFMPKVNTFH